jgi:hypothetical protein
MPTMSTVPFQSPSLPTNSHLPVTCTSWAAGVLLEVAVVLAGVDDGVGLAGVGAAGLVQELAVISSPIDNVAKIAFLIIYFLLNSFSGRFEQIPSTKGTESRAGPGEVPSEPIRLALLTGQDYYTNRALQCTQKTPG